MTFDVFIEAFQGVISQQLLILLCVFYDTFHFPDFLEIIQSRKDIVVLS